MKRKVEPIYSFKKRSYLTEEDAWEDFIQCKGYDILNQYFIIENEKWWDVYIII